MNDAPPRSFPLPDSTPDGADSDAEAPTSDVPPSETAPLSDEQRAALPDPHRDAIERLHARVEQAARTIERLEAENERLRERVAVLEQRPDVPEDHAILTFDGGPDALRDRLARYIEAIDRYLDRDAAATWENG
jgi:hypothetical protein